VGGRSINLAISTRGIDALRRVGLDGAVLSEAVRMPGRMIHGLGRNCIYQPYSADPDRAINSVSRGGLNLLLLRAAAQEPSITMHFGRRCTDIDFEHGAVELLDEGSGMVQTVQGDLVVAADGAYSVVRSILQKTEGFDYSQAFLTHGYKELTIPPRPDGSWAMEPNALHIWPRGGFMMIALPNQDRSFTCTLFLAHHAASAGEQAFDRIPGGDGGVGAEAFMERWFPDAVPLMPAMTEEFRRNPVGAMVTIRCWPWRRGRVVLLGDAAHAIVPFYGQGANCAFEDCVALAEEIGQSAADLPAALEAYQMRRRRNADAIAELALRNFVEMRDHTASRLFRARKRLERALSRALPGLFVPLYDMVSFTTMPYADAVERARFQWRAVGAATVGIIVLILGALRIAA
jgi:kynurenine 3-monooxygenase